jgi:Domain of Unknown Function (DUF1206)
MVLVTFYRRTRGNSTPCSAGYPVSGVLHLLVAYMIVRIALGSEGEADQTGALPARAAVPGDGEERCFRCRH